LKPIPFKHFIPGILWFTLVLVLICLPGQDVPKIDAWSNFLKKIHFDKMVHAGMFGVMALLFCMPYFKTDLTITEKNNRFIWVGILACIWGLATECIQLYVPGRSFDLWDWAADSFGVGVGLLFLKRFRRV